MSARLNFNEIAHFPWKGNTFKQIISNTQKNTNGTILSKYNLRLAQPLKIYRKEIVSVPINSCSRFVSIDEMNQPNGYLISNASTQNGNVETLDINLTSNSTERPGTCSALTTQGVCLDPAKNALKRCRSSGNLKKTYNVNRNNDTYYTSSKQYLESRNRLFAQNQFNYMKQGDLSALPGSSASDNNLYSTQGLNHCPIFSIDKDITFQYQWANGFTPYVSDPADINYDLDNIPTTVTIPKGYYQSIEDINRVFIQVMTANKHYYINNTTGAFVYLLNISYDSIQNKVVLQTFTTNTDYFNSANYTPALIGNTIPIGMPSLQYSAGPYFIITPAASELFGIPAADYPENLVPRVTGVQSTDRRAYPWTKLSGQWEPIIRMTSDYGTITPVIARSVYVPVYYKPNNSQYAQQGAVSASSRITRLKYNTITTNALKFRTALGESVGNALAYSTNSDVYTLKNKLGFPNKCTPVFNKYSDTMKKC